MMNPIDRPHRRLRSGATLTRLCVESTDERWHGRRVWVLTEPFGFDAGEVTKTGEYQLSVYVRRGFKTDYASIPRLFWWIFPHDECAEAAIIHDWLYQCTDCDRQLADSIFRLIMRLTRKPYLMRLAHYLGVRIGGWAARQKREDSSQ